jgi:hypothetical protein
LGEQIETLTQTHKKFYRSGSILNLNQILRLDVFDTGEIKDVSISYNMIFSRLEIDWLYNGEVIGHTVLQRGLNKKISFSYNRPFPATLEVKFTGPTGQVQLIEVSVTVKREEIPSQKEVSPVYKPFIEQSSQIQSTDYRGVISKFIQVNSSIKEEDRKLAERIKEDLIRKVIEVNIFDPKVIEVNIKENRHVEISVSENKVLVLGLTQIAERGVKLPEETKNLFKQIVRDIAREYGNITVDFSGSKFLRTIPSPVQPKEEYKSEEEKKYKNLEMMKKPKEIYTPKFPPPVFSQTVELSYDDGNLDANNGAGVGGGWAVRFSPPFEKTKIVKLKFFLTARPMPIEAIVIDKHGKKVFSKMVIPEKQGWCEVDLSSENVIVSGDFFAGFINLSPSEPNIGVDTTPPLDNRSYTVWKKGEIAAFIRDGDYMIRAVVENAEL